MHASSPTIPPPATPNWRNDNSVNQKAALLPIGWGESAETHLWYAIGKIKELPRADRKMLTSMFFTKEFPGHMEIVPDDRLRNGNMVLHVRGNVTLHPSIEILGRTHPLYQYGGSELLKDPSKPNPGIINFAALWD